MRQQQTIQSMACQQGYVLLLSSVFLILLAGSSVHFYTLITNSETVARESEDNSAAMVLAEAAMENLRIRFVNNRLTEITTVVPACASDACKTGGIQGIKSTITPGNALLARYMFYLSNGNGIDIRGPDILTRVANGEAANVASVTLPNRGINAGGVATLRVNDLFIDANQSPDLYIINNQGLLTISGAADWAAENTLLKAAAWLELSENPNDASSVDIFVQSVAQVDRAKVYLQRYVGTYFSSNIIGQIPTLAEGSNKQF